MNKFYKILLILTTLSGQLYAQKIDIIEHGQTYMNIKEMSYYDYKDKCHGEFRIKGVTFVYLFKDTRPLLYGYGNGSYLFSDFMNTMYRSKESLIDLKKVFSTYANV